MAFYDRIARRWEAVTGERGGAFKRHVLNDRLLGRIGAARGLDVLELGAGNGYFGRLLRGARLTLTDASGELLEIARGRNPEARCLRLDVRDAFPFENASFDLVLATMVFNEVPTPGLRHALAETRRVLRPGGRLVAAVFHPRMVESLGRRGQLHPAYGALTMPASKGLRVPVTRRSREEYEALFDAAGFAFTAEDVAPTPKVLAEKRGAAAAGKLPWALLFDAR